VRAATIRISRPGEVHRPVKKCRNCKSEFEPFQTTQPACSPSCALALVRAKKAKAYKQTTRKMRKEFNENDRGYQLKKCQQQFNAYIRARDAGKPCISCQKNSGAKMNAGHYLSVGAHPELRFDPLNCHLQCEACNSFLSGNVARYRINLIDRIGLEAVERLEGPHEPKKYTIDEIIEIKERYKAKLKALSEK